MFGIQSKQYSHIQYSSVKNVYLCFPKFQSLQLFQFQIHKPTTFTIDNYILINFNLLKL